MSTVCCCLLHCTARGGVKGVVMIRGVETKGGYVIFLFSFTSSLLNLPFWHPFPHTLTLSNATPSTPKTYPTPPLHMHKHAHDCMQACQKDTIDLHCCKAVMVGRIDHYYMYVCVCVCVMAVSHIALLMMMMITWQWEKLGVGVQADSQPKCSCVRVHSNVDLPLSVVGRLAC
jgi:hypothetical protein